MADAKKPKDDLAAAKKKAAEALKAKPEAPKPEAKKSDAKKRSPVSERLSKEGVGGACPRCNVSLGKTRYEGVSVDLCDACWGYWVGPDEFEAILKKKDESFSRDEKKDAGRAAPHEGDKKVLKCVTCSKPMQKFTVENEGTVAFLVDYCKLHGLWLDTGEIKRAQILDEKTGAVRKALSETFGGA